MERQNNKKDTYCKQLWTLRGIHFFIPNQMQSLCYQNVFYKWEILFPFEQFINCYYIENKTSDRIKNHNSNSHIKMGWIKNFQKQLKYNCIQFRQSYSIGGNFKT